MRTSRIIPIALILIIVAVAIAGLISLARAVFFSGNTSQTVTQVDVSQEALLSTTADRSVTLTVRGNIVADEKFRTYQIIVTPNSRTLTAYTGYLDKRTDQIALGNNIAAYEEFVFALSRADLVKGTELAGDGNDRRGICAIGRVFEFGVLKANTSVKTLWTTSCRDAKGSLKASLVELTNLFTNQIPGGQVLINKLSL